MTGGFHGAIAALAGKRSGKAYPFEQGETVSLGEGSACNICYDEKRCEYQVTPDAPRSVLLKSGQPLGEGRTYCLPRGAEITLTEDNSRYRLV